jgi:glycosyltransferase involved in cell wall biosynthesis
VLRGLDAFVLPSLAEGISNTILEAMASGLPVAATAVGGNVELVEEGVTGRLVPAAAPVALSAVLLEWLAEPARARALGRAGRAVAEARFGLDRMAADYERVYLSQLPRGIAAAAPKAA